MALDCRAPISTHTYLRETSDLLCQFFCLCARASFGSQVFAQTDVQAFFRGHFSPGQDNFEGAALADDSRQPNGSTVNQWHAPAPTIDAEVGLSRHHTKIAPQAQLHSASNSGALYCRDYRFIQLEARRPQRSARNVPAITLRTRDGNIQFAERI